MFASTVTRFLGRNLDPYDPVSFGNIGPTSFCTIAFFRAQVLDVSYTDETWQSQADLTGLTGAHWRDVLSALGGDAAMLEAQISALIDDGVSFATHVMSEPFSLIRIEGRTDGLQAKLVLYPAGPGEHVLYRELRQAQADQHDAERMGARSDLVPGAAFEIDEGGRLAWHNAAASDLLDAGISEATLNEFASETGKKRTMLRGADGRSLGWARVTVSQAPGHARLVHFENIDELVKTEQSLESFMATLTETFAHLSSALAIFDKDRTLSLFNPALTEIFDLDPAVLAVRPSFREFLEALRQRRMVPEQRDYTEWRQKLAQASSNPSGGSYCEDWTLPSGRILRVTARPHPHGALAYVFEDISSHVMLERKYRSEIEIGQATLERLSEAVAVFSRSGQVLHSNPAFGCILGVDPFEGLLDVGIDPLILAGAEKLGAPEVWQTFKQYALAADRQDRWEQVIRPKNGGMVVLRASALPDGSTLLALTQAPAPSRSEADGSLPSDMSRQIAS